jgi:hypothetical protein
VAAGPFTCGAHQSRREKRPGRPLPPGCLPGCRLGTSCLSHSIRGRLLLLHTLTNLTSIIHPLPHNSFLLSLIPPLGPVLAPSPAPQSPSLPILHHPEHLPCPSCPALNTPLPPSAALAAGRFNERMVLSLATCQNCILMDDELNILPTSTHVRQPAEVAQNACAGSCGAQ